MLKILSTKLAKLRKGIVVVGGNGINKAKSVGKYKVGGNDSSDNSDKKCLSDAPKSMCPPALRALMLKTSLSTDSSVRAAQFPVDYNGVDDGGGCNDNSERKFTSLVISNRAILY